METRPLHWVDWVVFAAMLAISCGIGLFHSFSGGKQKTVGEYVQGGGRIGIFPAAISLTVSFISSILILGHPAEVYTFGAQYWLSFIASICSAILCSYIYVPVLYPLRMISVNHYVLRRFKSRVPLTIMSVYSVLISLFYSAVVSFGQATCIEAISGFPTWAGILVGNSVAVLYTTFGGIRGVVWADVFQALVLIVGLLAVVVQGILSVGGIGNMFQINNDWGRLGVVWDPSPTVRMNVYGLIIGNALSYSSVDGHFQAAFQRYNSQPSLSKARQTIYLSLPGNFTLRTLAVLAGLAVFAFFTSTGCDPVKGGLVDNPNQIIPYFVMQRLYYPGLPGLFLACVAAGALSTISSMYNAQASQIWDDVLRYYVKVSDERASTVVKGLCLLCGVVSTLLAFIASQLGGNLMQMMSTFSSSMAGPMAGVFLLGFFFPWGNSKGASVGCLLGTVVATWIAFGSYTVDTQYGKLPVNTANCTNDVISDVMLGNATTPYSDVIYGFNVTSSPLPGEVKEVGGGFLHSVYSISFLWMKEVATAVTIIVAILVSFITGRTKPGDLEPELLHPWIRRCAGNRSADVSMEEIKRDEIGRLIAKELGSIPAEGEDESRQKFNNNQL